MASFAKATIVGYLGRDPELKFSAQGEAVCKFSVAASERRKNQQGDYENQTTWFAVIVFRRQAEIAAQYLTKGSPVYIEGRIRLNEYTDREGNRRASLEVTASDVQFIGVKGETQAAVSVPAKASEPASSASATQDDFDVPF